MRRRRVHGSPTAVIAVHSRFLVAQLSEVTAAAEVRVAGTAYDRHSATRIVSLLQPDLLISEVSPSARDDDLALLASVHELASHMRIVAILPGEEPALIEDVVGAGAAVYALPETEPEDLAIAIRQLFRQVIFIADDYTFGEDGELPPLTRRETLILRLVAEGYTNHEVAERLGVSEPTVKFHLTNVFRKLGVGNRTEASSLAREHGLTLLGQVGIDRGLEAVGAQS